MAALTQDRNTPRRSGDEFSHPLAAATTIYAGSLVCLDASGNAVPGSVATTLVAAGRAEEQVDNSGGIAGALAVQVRKGVFCFTNAGDVTRAHIGDNAYIDDDQTVTAVTTGRSVAGTIVDVDANGVWIKIA